MHHRIILEHVLVHHWVGLVHHGVVLAHQGVVLVHHRVVLVHHRVVLANHGVVLVHRIDRGHIGVGMIMVLLWRFGHNPAFAEMCWKLRLAGTLLIVGLVFARLILWLHCWWTIWLLRAGFVIRLSNRNTFM